MRHTRALIAVAGALMADPDGQHWGYPLERSAGVRSGALYPILRRMLEGGWLEDGWEAGQPHGRPPRRYYTLTAKGKAEMGALIQNA